MPPRLTLGSVNALVASHFLIVPSALDRMSTEALSQFLKVARAIKGDLDLDIDLLGAVGTLSKANKLSAREQRSWDKIGEYCRSAWGDGREYRITRTVPHKAKIAEAAGESIAYLSGGNDVQEIFSQLGAEIWERMFRGLPIEPVSDGSPQEPHE